MPDSTTTGEVHPAADLFPLMGTDELRALADDIREHGLRQPVVLDAEGRILDGRNRLAACALAEVEPEFVSVNGDDPVALVVSLNVKRRNLNTGQRAIAAAQSHGKSSMSAADRDRLAEQFSASTRYIQMAYALVKDDPPSAEAVKVNDLTLKDAYDDLQKRQGKTKGEGAERAKLRAEHPDLAERVDSEALTLGEARAEAERRDAEAKQQRWAATTNVLEGLAPFDRGTDPDEVRRLAGLVDQDIAARSGHEITPDRLRRAAAFASALADEIERTTQ